MSGFGSRLGHKSWKGAVSASNYKGRIRLRWRYLGARYSLSLSYWCDLNLLEAQKVALQIEQDMIVGTFDPTLLRYAPMRGVKKAALSVRELSFTQIFEYWTKEFKQMDCEVHTNYNSTRNMIRKWGRVTAGCIVKKLNCESICAATFNRRLTVLKNFVDWLVAQGHWDAPNPLAQVNRRKQKKQPLPKREPFTEDEIKSILQAIKDDRFCSQYAVTKHSFYYPFLYFLFKTGVRNAEAVGLRVGSVNLDSKRIHIHEVLARGLKGCASIHRTRKETKNGKERQLPLTADLELVLKPLLEGKSYDDLVFTSPKGLPIDDHNFQNRVFKKVLQELKIPERVLYAARHTFGSRCVDGGMTPVMTAFLMGNNPETALRRYTHQISLPADLPEI